MTPTTPEPRKSSRLSTKKISTSSGGLVNSSSSASSSDVELQSITSQVTPQAKEKKQKKKELTDSQRKHRMQLRVRTPITK